MPPPRLLFCSWHCYADPSSGAAVSTRDLLELLAARGWACGAFSASHLDFEQGAAIDANLAGQGVRPEIQQAQAGPVSFRLLRFVQRGVPVNVFHSDGIRPYQEPPRPEGHVFLALMERLIAEFQPDLLLTYGGDWLAREIIARAGQRGIKVVFGLHNLEYHDASLFRGVDAVVVPSQFVAGHYRGKLGLECVALPGPWDWSRVLCETAGLNRAARWWVYRITDSANSASRLSPLRFGVRFARGGILWQVQLPQR